MRPRHVGGTPAVAGGDITRSKNSQKKARRLRKGRINSTTEVVATGDVALAGAEGSKLPSACVQRRRKEGTSVLPSNTPLSLWLLAEDSAGENTKAVIANINGSNGKGNDSDSDSDDDVSMNTGGMVPYRSATGPAECGRRSTRANASTAGEGSSPRAIGRTGVVARREQAAGPEGEPSQDRCERAAERSSASADMFRASLDRRLDGISILPSDRKREFRSEGRGTQSPSGWAPTPVSLGVSAAGASATESRQETESAPATAAAEGGTNRDGIVSLSRSAGVRTAAAPAETVMGESRSARATCSCGSIPVLPQNTQSRWEWEKVTVDWKLKVG